MENQEKNETTVLPENPEIMVKNPRIGKVRKLEEEVRRQNELEQLRTKRIRKEQEYIEQMSKAVEDHLRNTREEQRYNEEFERLIRKDVYRMHGISEDKLQGMTEYRNAWYQGTAFGMFFLSLILTGLAFLFFLDSAGHRQIYNCRGLRHCVEGLCELALLVRGSILVDDTVRSSLIDLLYGKQICALRGFLVAGLNGSIILLDNGAKLIVCHLVAKRFSLNDFYALFR